MKTTWVKLKDVCDTTSGGTPSRDVAAYYGGDIPWVKSGELLDGLITDTEERITKAGLASSSAKLFPAGTLLIALYGATVGRLGILGIDATTNQAVCGITPKDGQLDRDFLFYHLLKQREKLIGSRTGGAQPNISQDIIRELDIPLPPLTEQSRIASLLARADRLRQLRRTAHDLGDALLQSMFLEMFGDGSKFDRVEFEEILEENPKNGLYLSSDQYGSGTPIIRIDAFYDGVLGNPAYFKRLRATPKQIEEFRVQNDEILINRVNSLEYLGKCALVKGLLETTLFESNMIRIRINRKLANPVYVTKYLTTPQAYGQIMQKAKKAVNQASINQQDVKSIVIPVPPLSLQEEFSGVVRRVESLRGRMGESERQVEGLFGSLLAEAFV